MNGVPSVIEFVVSERTVPVSRSPFFRWSTRRAASSLVTAAPITTSSRTHDPHGLIRSLLTIQLLVGRRGFRRRITVVVCQEVGRREVIRVNATSPAGDDDAPLGIQLECW